MRESRPEPEGYPRERIHEPVRYLVLGILRQAWRDYLGTRTSPEHRLSASQFLRSDDYVAFCGYLGIRPSRRFTPALVASFIHDRRGVRTAARPGKGDDASN